MTRVFDRPQRNGGTRLLILGASAYPHAQDDKLRVPELSPISGAAASAIEFAFHAIERWRDRFVRPLASVDLLADAPDAPDGVLFRALGGADHQLAPPTMANIKEAQKAWLADAKGEDVLIFYCCGHGVWLPATGRTFLAASFGVDAARPWADAIALDDFALALGESPPRQQWLIFDCCTTIPAAALRGTDAPDPLLATVEGGRKAAEDAYGQLAQVIAASSSIGPQAFGKDGRASRFMEAFLEACAGAGCRATAGGKWWIDQQGLEDAIATYGARVASIQDETYYKFPRVTHTDAAEVPRLLWQDEKPHCTLLVRSVAPDRLKAANLKIRCGNQHIGGQTAGPQAAARFRMRVPAWLQYDLEAMFIDTGPVTRTVFAVPPLAEALF
jgi:hypothetical protein